MYLEYDDNNYLDSSPVDLLVIDDDSFELEHYLRKEEFLERNRQEEKHVDEEYRDFSDSMLELRKPRLLNTVHLLRQREIGRTNLTRSREANSVLLMLLIQHRWPSISELEFFSDVEILLARGTKHEEGSILQHLYYFGIPKIPSIKWEIEHSVEYYVRPLQPLTFLQLLDVMHKCGFDLACTDKFDGNRNFVMKVVNDILFVYIPHRNIASLITYLTKRGIYLNAAELLKIFCKRMFVPSFGVATEDTVTIVKLLLESSRRTTFQLSDNPFVDFVRNVDLFLSVHAVEITRLFIEFGYYYEGALQEFCSDSVLHSCFSSKDNFEHVFAIFHLLIETANSLSPLLYCEAIHNTNLRNVYAYWCSRKTINYGDIVSYFAERKMDLGGILSYGHNLLTAVCRYYDGVELPFIIRMLCKNGCDVNHFNYFGENALMCLFHEPFSKVVYDAAKELLDNQINQNFVDLKGRNALNIIISNIPLYCCNYRTIKKLNESHFWDALDLLLDVWICVDEKRDQGMTIPGILFRKFDSYIICTKCAKSLGLGRKKAIEEAQRLIHYARLLRFVDRLLKAGAPLYAKYWDVGYSLLLYVCAFFRGDVLVSLVRLLCENGVDVNAATLTDPWDIVAYIEPFDAIDILKLENHSRNNRIIEVLAIMRQFGYVKTE